MLASYAIQLYIIQTQNCLQNTKFKIIIFFIHFEGIAITEGRSEGIPAKGLNALVGLWVEGSAEESVGSLVGERGCL